MEGNFYRIERADEQINTKFTDFTSNNYALGHFYKSDNYKFKNKTE